MTNFTMLVRNRPRLTKQALLSLYSPVPSDASITVVDDRSGPVNREWLQRWAEHRQQAPYTTPLDLVLNDCELGTGPLRNAAITRSEQWQGRGDYLYLSDNDVFFKPSWLGYLIKAYNFAWEYGYRVIGAVNHPFHQPVSTLAVTKGSYTILNVNEVNALATQSMLMRWEVWDKYGPFCQTPVDKVCQSEDVDFTNKIRADGYKIGVVSPPLVVSTGITNTFGEKIPGYELVKAQCPEGIICE